MSMTDEDLSAYLDECRALVLPEIRRIVPESSPYATMLYDRMLDYPLRAAKMLRPALCIATCRALGGHLEAVLPSAAVLELYHNAFLVHDDVEDRSEMRRDAATLHALYGVPIAVNVGDAMLALALRPLLDNMRTVGMGVALRVLESIAEMARESVEGQALELEWIRDGAFDVGDGDYLHMVEKKTSFYSFITPLVVGGLIAGAGREQITAMRRFGALLGIAFQIQDDVLNLTADYGKEPLGDLWEGKHTLILIHMMRSATPSDRERARAILRRARPTGSAARHEGDVGGGACSRGEEWARAVELLAREGHVSVYARDWLISLLGAREREPETKTDEDVAFLHERILEHGSLGRAQEIARARASEARSVLESFDWLRASVHRAFLEKLVDYVVQRGR